MQQFSAHRRIPLCLLGDDLGRTNVVKRRRLGPDLDLRFTDISLLNELARSLWSPQRLQAASSSSSRQTAEICLHGCGIAIPSGSLQENLRSLSSVSPGAQIVTPAVTF